MNDIKRFLIRIVKRIKKYWIILVAIPILMSAVAFWASDSSDDRLKGPFTSNAEVYLGTFDYNEYIEPERAIETVKSSRFLNQAIEELDLEVDKTYLQENLNVTKVSSKSIRFSITGDTEEASNAIIGKITDFYIGKSKEAYNKRLALLNQKIKDVESIPDNTEAAVEKEKYLYELETKKSEWAAPEIINPPELVSEEANSGISKKNKVILGFLIGIMASMFLVLMPEVLRK